MRRDSLSDLSDPVLVRAAAEKAAKAQHLLHQAARDYAPIVFASSLGAEDMVLTDLIWKEGIDIEIFTLDTGRLPAETCELITRTERRYGRRMQIYSPERESVEAFVAEHGIDGFYDSAVARKACCHARKVEPLRRALAGKKAWVTGLRAEQSPTREALKPVSFDTGFNLVKISPLADWREQEVWAYLHTYDVPYNALHDRHYPSIGCAPCTRAVQPGGDVRAGRWWWESPATKECGLHVIDGQLARKVGAGGTAADAP
jgi:phosphoadenosine phosphosulfate reductase